MKRFIALALVGLLCFFLLVPSVGVYASTVTYEFESFDTRFSPEDDLPVFTTSAMQAAYTGDGGNFSNVSTRSIPSSSYPFQTGSSLSNQWWQGLYSSIPIPTSENVDGVVTDLSKAYVIVYGGNYTSSTPSSFNVTLIKTSGIVACISGVVVSTEPIYYIELTSNGTTTWNAAGALPLQSVTSVSGNGFYCLQTGSYFHLGNYYLAFTDLPIYLPSSDGYSGFYNFSLESTDYSTLIDCYDFNYIKEGNFFTGPNDVIPEPPSDSIHYLNANVSANLVGSPFNSLYLDTKFYPNSYIQLHPEQFTLQYKMEFVVANEDSTVIQFEDDQHTWIDVSTLARNGYWGFTQSIDTNDFLEGSNDLYSWLRTQYSNVTGTTSSYYSEGDYSLDPNWGILYNENVYKGLKGSLIFGNSLNSTNHGLTMCTFTCEFTLSTVSEGVETYSGTYRYNFDLLTGNESVTNNMTTNLYPTENDNGLGNINTNPSGGGGSSTSYGGNAYGGNVNINMGDNVNFGIPEASYLAVQDAWEHLLVFFDVNKERSVWAFIGEGFGCLPQPIWGWILASVATITVVSTVNYVRKR